jgi:hypothetical protein
MEAIPGNERRTDSRCAFGLQNRADRRRHSSIDIRKGKSMNDDCKIGLSILGTIVALLAVIWVAQGNDFFMYKVFAPKYEAARRQTFEQSKAYNQGMIQELQNMQFQYEQADKAHKQALASIILHRAADYDESKLPIDLYQFIQKLKTNQGGTK